MKVLNRALTIGMISLMPWAATEASISDNKVKIGVLADMGGPLADPCGAGCVEAVKMAVEDFGGTVLGKPIEVIYADDQNKPDVGATKAREWLDTQEVDVLAGLIHSGVSAAVSQISKQNKKIMLLAGAGSNIFSTSLCSPYTAQWTFDVVALANGTVKTLVDSGKKNWFFITTDYKVGHALENVATNVIESNGGVVAGAVRAPLGTTDFSSFVLQAQASGADVVALATVGADFGNSLKTASEFGLQEMVDVAGLLVLSPNVQALDPSVTAGMKATVGFYWNRTEETTAWSRRFEQRVGSVPSMVQAGAYSSTLHYLRSVKAAGTDESDAVMAKMKTNKPSDFFAKNAYLRGDGLLIHDMYQVRVKGKDERSEKDDFYALENIIPGDDAFAPMVSECNFKS